MAPNGQRNDEIGNSAERKPTSWERAEWPGGRPLSSVQAGAEELVERRIAFTDE